MGNPSDSPYANFIMPSRFGHYDAPLAINDMDLGLSDNIGRPRNYWYQQGTTLNLQQLFPALGLAPLIRKPVPAKATVWSPEIVAIVKSLDQRATLRQLQGVGLILDRVVESYEPRRSAIQSINRRLECLSSAGWLTQQMNDQTPTLLDWCTADERASLNLTFFTGRQRASSQPEREMIPIDWDDHSLEDAVRNYGQWPAQLEKLAGNLVRITLAYPEKLSVIWIIDTERQVLVKVEHLNEGKVNSSVVYADFQQVAGRWWATRRTAYDGRGRMVTQSIQKVQAVAPEMMAQRISEAKKQSASCLMLPSPLPTLAEAKKATAPGGTGGAVEHLILMSHYAATQQWQRVKEHLAHLERQQQQYSVVPMIRLLVLYASRDHATLQNEVWKQTQALLKQAMAQSNDDWARYYFLQTQLANIAWGAEALRYLEAHAAIFARQPAYLRPMRTYQTYQAQYLGNANRREEALAIWKKLAESDLFDSTHQTSYFSMLLQGNDVDTAQQHFNRLLEPDRQVFINPDDSQHYWQQLFIKLHELGRYADAFSLASQWVKRESTQRLAHHAYLLALILTEQEEEFNRTQMEWIKAGPGSKAGTMQDRQFDSALSVALHQSYFGFEHQWQNPMDERLYDPLVAFAEAHLADLRQVGNVHSVLSSPAGNSARGMALREGIPARIAEECATLPIEKVQAMFQNAAYVTSRNEAMTKAQQKQWEQIAATLKNRWQGLADVKARNAMGDLLSQVLQQRVSPAAYVAFLRERLVQEAEIYRLDLLNQLYAHLFQQEMTAAIESELFSLVTKLDQPDQPASVLLAVRSQRLLQLCDRLFEARSTRLINSIPEKEKLDRVKLQEKQTEAAKQAHRELAQRLQQPDVKFDSLAPWVEAEVLYHRIKAGDDLTALSDAVWKAYDAVPPARSKLTGDTIKTVEELDQLRLDVLHESLRDRHLTVLTYLAAQQALKEPSAAQKLKSFVTAKLKSEPTSDYWKLALQRLLIALDQPKELESSLREWLLAAGTDQRYRLMLAYLQAERGGLQEAVDLLEKVKADDELAPADWRALSDWLLVLNQQARHQQAKAQQYAASSEQALFAFLQNQQALVSRQGQGVPVKLDDDTFVVITELFRKTQSPINYFHIVQSLYEVTKDFRLLAGLADGTLGHTPGQVYDMLQHWRQLISLIQEEATLDELSKRIKELRTASISSVDRRAVDLLEAFLHRKAATQLNQPDVHARQAVECLHRAMRHEWQRRNLLLWLSSSSTCSRRTMPPGRKRCGPRSTSSSN
ncbi:MAG: hypothetical protein QM703_07275 [Gemmatales bacterium]